jgi:hypothetical protein
VLAAVIAALHLQVARAQVRPAIPDEVPLTPAQEASIRDEMTQLAGWLMSAGKSPQEAKLAANAVGMCLGAAYGRSLTREQASTVCGQVLDAFTVQPGTIAYELTDDDRAWIASSIENWTAALATMLSPEELGAVRSTMAACLEGHMKRGEGRGGSVKACERGLLPLLNRPELVELLLESQKRLP